VNSTRNYDLEYLNKGVSSRWPDSE